MPRMSTIKRPKARKPKPSRQGDRIVCRDKSQISQITDWRRPKIDAIEQGDHIVFLEAGERFTRRGEVISKTKSAIIVNVEYRYMLLGQWKKGVEPYEISAACVLGTVEDFEARFPIVDRLVGGRIIGLGPRRDGVGAPVSFESDALELDQDERPDTPIV
jgi:hypothetical protein